MKNFYKKLKEEINYSETIDSIIDEETKDMFNTVPNLDKEYKKQVTLTLKLGAALQRKHNMQENVKWSAYAVIISIGLSIALLINFVVSIIIT